MTREHVSGKFVAIAGLLCSVACSSPNFNDVGSLNGGGTSGSSSGGAAGSTGGNSTGGNSTGGNSTGGNSTGGNSTGGNGGSSVTAGASGGSAADSPILCDGKDALRFAVQSGGGNVSGIPSLVLETGFSFLLIDGRCRYYAMTAPDQEIRTGTLTATDAQNLSVDFLLGRWQGLEHSGFGCPDAGTQSFAFGHDRAESSCTTTPLTTALEDWLARLYDAGSPVSADVRYGVIGASDQAWPQNNPQSALAYPFEDPAPIVTEPFSKMKPQLASGADATTLRELRASYQSGPKPVPAPSYSIPVKVEATGAEPMYYDLVIRDTVPFETDGVLAIDDFIE